MSMWYSHIKEAGGKLLPIFINEFPWKGAKKVVEER